VLYKSGKLVHGLGKPDEVRFERDGLEAVRPLLGKLQASAPGVSRLDIW